MSAQVVGVIKTPVGLVVDKGSLFKEVVMGFSKQFKE
jgi:hypothetical protein